MFVLRVSGQSGLVNHSFFLAHSIMASSSNPVPPQAPPSGSQEKLFDECICSELQKRGGKTTASTRGEHTEHCTGNERISTHASLPISNDSQISGEISGNCIFLELADFQRNFRKPRSGPTYLARWPFARLPRIHLHAHSAIGRANQHARATVQRAPTSWPTSAAIRVPK